MYLFFAELLACRRGNSNLLALNLDDRSIMMYLADVKKKCQAT